MFRFYSKTIWWGSAAGVDDKNSNLSSQHEQTNKLHTVSWVLSENEVVGWFDDEIIFFWIEFAFKKYFLLVWLDISNSVTDELFFSSLFVLRQTQERRVLVTFNEFKSSFFLLRDYFVNINQVTNYIIHDRETESERDRNSNQVRIKEAS